MYCAVIVAEQRFRSVIQAINIKKTLVFIHQCYIFFILWCIYSFIFTHLQNQMWPKMCVKTLRRLRRTREKGAALRSEQLPTKPAVFRDETRGTNGEDVGKVLGRSLIGCCEGVCLVASTNQSRDFSIRVWENAALKSSRPSVYLLLTKHTLHGL